MNRMLAIENKEGENAVKGGIRKGKWLNPFSGKSALTRMRYMLETNTFCVPISEI